MRTIYWLAGIVVVGATIWELLQGEQSPDTPRHQELEGFSVTRSNLPGNQEMLRFRGSYDDIMRALGVIQEEKPPLPPGLDTATLPRYQGGCPHCGKTSMVGENMWRYQELSRTRGPYDNTTTFLTRCKSCKGFMQSCVDHDD